MEKSSDKESLFQKYQGFYEKGEDSWRKCGAKYKANNIRHLSKGITTKKVLEWGAGEGSLLYWLDYYHFSDEFYAAEISETGIAAIKKRNLPSLKEVIPFNGYSLPYPDNFFDLAILSHVLEHVEHPRLLLRELKRISKFQIIEVPLDYSSGIDEKASYFLNYGHINIYTPALFRFLLISEGFLLLKERKRLIEKEVLAYDMFVNKKKRPRILWKLIIDCYILSKRIQKLIIPFGIKHEFIYNTISILCTDDSKKRSIL